MDDYLNSHQSQAIPPRTPAGRRDYHYDNDVVLNMYQETLFCPNTFVLDSVRNTFIATTRRNRYKSYGAVSDNGINNTLTYTNTRNHHNSNDDAIDNDTNNTLTVNCGNYHNSNDNVWDNNSSSSPLTIYKNTEYAVVPLLHAEDEIYERLTSCFKVSFIDYLFVFLYLSFKTSTMSPATGVEYRVTRLLRKKPTDLLVRLELTIMSFAAMPIHLQTRIDSFKSYRSYDFAI